MTSSGHRNPGRAIHWPKGRFGGAGTGIEHRHVGQRRRIASYSTQEWLEGELGLRPRRPRETLDDFDHLMVRSATWVAKLVDRMFVGEPVQAHQLARALAPIQLQLGRPISEQEKRPA